MPNGNKSLRLNDPLVGSHTAKIGRVNDTDVVLRRAHIAGVLECDPGMSRLEYHREHLLPEIEGLDLVAVDLPLLCQLLVVDVELLEFAAIGVMEVRHLVGAE